jgi:hypothetical protein
VPGRRGAGRRGPGQFGPGRARPAQRRDRDAERLARCGTSRNRAVWCYAATLPLPVQHGEPAGAAQDDIGQSLASTSRKSRRSPVDRFMCPFHPSCRLQRSVKHRCPCWRSAEGLFHRWPPKKQPPASRPPPNDSARLGVPVRMARGGTFRIMARCRRRLPATPTPRTRKCRLQKSRRNFAEREPSPTPRGCLLRRVSTYRAGGPDIRRLPNICVCARSGLVPRQAHISQFCSPVLPAPGVAASVRSQALSSSASWRARPCRVSALACTAAELSRPRRSGQPGSVPLARRSGAEW